ncbi:hypothetical protein [Sandaracinus amylolyticus]|uniref:hypothetical protein n=1 Tax=Sandaracinus amylolyticus TaxID=927083 RepID=UPI001F4416F0|nr:hypothetical protein [Sandaracinus amylolyticus]UJR78432.1 Signal transduction response regulator [Sandaracinus amylolyticus]
MSPSDHSLVGRARELAELEALLASGERLVTLTGLGGIGKSALARCIGAGESDVVRCDLDEATTVEALSDAVAAALDAGPGGSPRDPSWPARAIAARGPVLLVLDPLDRVAGAAARIAEWLACAPELVVLAVSRERLQIPGEIAYEVGPIATDDDAIALFVAAAGAQRHGYAPSDDERKVIAEIVRELDRVPLAIELAAARLAVMGPAALLHRLRSRFDVLRRPGGRGRHGALEASLAWSWEILEPWEREVLAQCTVFRGGFGLDAVEAVVATSVPVIDVIAALRAKSMIRAQSIERGELRLSLYESVRAYATRGVGEGARELEARHAKHFVEQAERWAASVETRDGDEARAWLALERENLLAVVERILGRGTVSARIAELALRALVALVPVLSVRGPLELYARHLERALEVTAGSGADPRLQARGLLVRGALRRQRGDVAGAERDLGEALVLAHHTGDAAVEARALLAVSRIASQRGDLERASAAIERAIAIESGDPGGEARGWIARAELAWARGDRDAARDALERARARGMRSALIEAAIRRRLALVELSDGRADDARAHLAVARELAGALHDRRGLAIARALGGVADHVEGRLDDAAGAYREAIADLAAGGFVTLEAIVGGALGMVHAERGDRAEARLLVQGARAALEGGDPALDAFFTCVLARIEALAGRDAAGRALFVVARGRSASAADASVVALVDAIEASKLEGAPPSLALTLIARLRASSARPQVQERADAVRVGDAGSWFRVGGGERVELAKRKPLRRILDRLADEHASAPGRALAWDALIEAGWPGEKMRADAGAHRVRVAISTLRKMGLRDVVKTVEQGYLLDAQVPIVRD